jgi:hypothetical protein
MLILTLAIKLFVGGGGVLRSEGSVCGSGSPHTRDAIIQCTTAFSRHVIRWSCPCALIKHYAMKTYGRVGVEIQVFLTFALAGREWSASRPGRFIPDERAPGTHWIEGWVGPTASLDDMEKILDPTRSRTPALLSSSPWPAAIRTALFETAIQEKYKLYYLSLTLGKKVKLSPRSIK